MASVRILPNDPVITRGTELQLTLELRDANGKRVSDRLVTWSSSDDQVAVVQDSSRLYAPGNGVATVTATSEGVSGQVHVTVLSGQAVSSVYIRPSSRPVLAGSVFSLKAEARDAAGEQIYSTFNGVWTALDPSVAAFNGGGTGPVNSEAVFVNFGRSGTARFRGAIDSVSSVATYPILQVAWSSVSMGRYVSCGTTTSRQGYCWGTGDAGTTGTGSLETQQVPTQIAGPVRFDTVSAGRWNSCGLDGGVTWCWGQSGGQPYSGLPDTTAPAIVPGLPPVRTVSVGLGHVCTLSVAGSTYCFGGNFHGELGAGSVAPAAGPVAVSGGHQFAQIDVGRFHTCGVAVNGAVWCWGNDDGGQLGVPGLGYCDPNFGLVCSAVPVQVASALQFTTVSAGATHTCALAADGAAWCWGANDEGQLGNGAQSPSEHTPVAVAGGLHFTAISAGALFTCALVAGGQAYCWGANADGQLGDNGSTRQLSPVPVNTTERFATLSSGESQSCGVTSAGVAWCWGSNVLFELGNGHPSYARTPIRLPG